MRHSEVLVVTKNATMPKILNWKVSTVDNVETAIEKLQSDKFKVVAVSNEIAAADKSKLQSVVAILHSDMPIVEYQNDTTFAEKVNRAYWSNKRLGAKCNYLDNSFEIKLANSINLN